MTITYLLTYSQTWEKEAKGVEGELKKQSLGFSDLENFPPVRGSNCSLPLSQVKSFQKNGSVHLSDNGIIRCPKLSVFYSFQLLSMTDRWSKRTKKVLQERCTSRLWRLGQVSCILFFCLESSFPGQARPHHSYTPSVSSAPCQCVSQVRR